MGQLFFTRWTAEPGRFESAAEVLFLHCPEPVLETEIFFLNASVSQFLSAVLCTQIPLIILFWQQTDEVRRCIQVVKCF